MPQRSANVFEHWTKSHVLKDQIRNPNIQVGDYTYYSGYYHARHFEEVCVRYLSPEEWVTDKLVIGRFCSIGSGAAFIMCGNQGHRSDWVTTYPFYYTPDLYEGAADGFLPKGDTVVGSDVWIGTEAMIMPGVSIGHGAVIASRAVVTRNVEPYTIVGGNPARPIRSRFGEEEIALLLEARWWELEIEDIQPLIPLLSSGRVHELAQEVLRLREKKCEMQREN
ncbi:acetyltransferase [Saccharibacillus sp. O16]|nr:acetyltransferase [Saccharibacillus sp. O16]